MKTIYDVKTYIDNETTNLGFYESLESALQAIVQHFGTLANLAVEEGQIDKLQAVGMILNITAWAFQTGTAPSKNKYTYDYDGQITYVVKTCPLNK